MVRIFIADDHEVVRRGVRTVLETCPGNEVVGEAADGNSAVRDATALKPDVVVLDYSLPQLNGLDVTRRLRQSTPRSEILIFTMHERESIIWEVLDAGARGYLLKSDADTQLLDAVSALAQHRPYFSWRVSEAILEEFLDKHHRPTGNVLSPREREIVQLIAEGKSNKVIGRQLDLSIKTVETHRASAMRKLSLTSTADLVRYAVRNNLIVP